MEYVMKTISLKLDDSVFEETEQVLSTIKKARNRYINEAVAFYNNIQKKKLLEEILKRESELVSANSMQVLQEFEAIDYED